MKHIKETSSYKSLRDYTDKELLDFLDNNMTTDLKMLAGICSEILRRMNQLDGIL